MLQALEGYRPFSNRQFDEQLCNPDRPILSYLDQARDNDTVKENVIAARRETDELIGQ